MISIFRWLLCVSCGEAVRAHVRDWEDVTCDNCGGHGWVEVEEKEV